MTEDRSSATTITFPDPLAEKCLRLEAAGHGLSRAMITIPSLVKPGEPFGATVSLLDANAMPIVAQDEAVTLSLQSGTCATVSFPAGHAAVARVEGLTRNASGYFRVEGEVAGRTFVSNPGLATTEDRPLVVWGDPHIHTTVGDCHAERCRTRNLAYAAARHAYGLDFIAIADHISWSPRGTAGKWYDNLACCELFDEPGRFSTIYCYETSMRGGRGGDCNVYMWQPNPTYIDPWPDDLNLAQLCELVEGKCFAVPHHTTRTKKHGEIPAKAYPGELLMPAVEIHSKWGTSEYRGNPTPLLDVHPGPSYVQDLLAQGYRFGFIGGTDSHTSLTFCQKLECDAHQALPGLTAALVTENRRDVILDAIQKRHCYAACGERILLSVACAGLGMGQAGDLPESGQVEIVAEFAAETPVASVEVIRNNEVVYREDTGDWQGRLAWTDLHALHARPIAEFGTNRPALFYYVRLTASSGARAWSSPVWLDMKFCKAG